jgi:hypothetical protein
MKIQQKFMEKKFLSSFLHKMGVACDKPINFMVQAVETVAHPIKESANF